MRYLSCLCAVVLWVIVASDASGGGSTVGQRLEGGADPGGVSPVAKPTEDGTHQCGKYRCTKDGNFVTGYDIFGPPSCAYFTRPLFEKVKSLYEGAYSVRRNTYASGSIVCVGTTYYLCTDNGSWRDWGVCDATDPKYHDNVACTIERTDPKYCETKESQEQYQETFKNQDVNLYENEDDMGAGAGAPLFLCKGQPSQKSCKEVGTVGDLGSPTKSPKGRGRNYADRADTATNPFAPGLARTGGNGGPEDDAGSRSENDACVARVRRRIDAASSNISGVEGVCGSARFTEMVSRTALRELASCPAADPTGQARMAIQRTLQQALETERHVCVGPTR